MENAKNTYSIKFNYFCFVKNYSKIVSGLNCKELGSCHPPSYNKEKAEQTVNQQLFLDH